MSREPRTKVASWGLRELSIDDDLDHFLARSDIDLVEFCCRTTFIFRGAEGHRRREIVSLQKPMCLDLDEADRLVAGGRGV